jgi:hypothetical protein
VVLGPASTRLPKLGHAAAHWLGDTRGGQ